MFFFIVNQLFILILISSLFRFEYVQNHHNQEDGHGNAEQDAQQRLSDELEAERLKEKQGKMVDEHQTEHIAEEP
jgi:hypothetical protein